MGTLVGSVVGAAVEVVVLGTVIVLVEVGTEDTLALPVLVAEEDLVVVVLTVVVLIVVVVVMGLFPAELRPWTRLATATW